MTNLQIETYRGTGVDISSSTWSSAVSNGKTMCILSGDGTKGNALCATTTDGITWKTGSTPIPTPNGFWYSSAWNGSVFCACAFPTGSASSHPVTSAVATSPDGLVWTRHDLPKQAGWKITAMGSLFCALSSDGKYSATSTDGSNWTLTTLPADSKGNPTLIGGISGLGASNSLICGVSSQSNAAIISTDGINWTAVTLPKTAFWWNVVSDGTNLLISAPNSQFYTGYYAVSANGTDWTLATIDPKYVATGVAWNGSYFFGVNGVYGCASTDGINWTTQIPLPIMGYNSDGPIAPNWVAVAAIGSQFVAIQNMGSKIAIVKTPPTPGSYPDVNISVPQLSNNNKFSLQLADWSSVSTVAVTSKPQNGTIQQGTARPGIEDGQTFTYTPNVNQTNVFPGNFGKEGFYGVDPMQVTLTNSMGTSNPINVNITVTPLKPNVNGFSTSVVQNSSGNVIDLTNEIVHWPGLVSGKSILNISTPPSNGTAAAGTGKSITYTPKTGYAGNDSVMITATNEIGTSISAKITITVTPLPPICSDVPATTVENTKTSINLKNSVTPWTSKTSVSITSQPSHGSVSLNTTTATYTPTSGYFGTDSFGYSATNETGPGNTGTVNVTVNIAKPVTSNMSTSVVENSSNNTIDLSKMITNWTSQSSVQMMSVPSHGTASVSGATITYSPTTGYIGNDTIKYNATNESGTSSTSTVTIAVTPLAPVCIDITPNTNENTKVNIALKNSISNWTSKSTAAISTQPSHGTASISGQTISYTPAKDYFGTDTMQYTATNETGASQPATITVTINISKPTVSAVTASVVENSSNTIDLSKNITNWTNNSSVSLASPPSHGIASVSGSSILYSPTTGYIGSDMLMFTVTNEGGTSSSSKVTITVTPLAPVCSDLAASTNENVKTTINLKSSISNWTSKSSVAISSQPSHGSASVNGQVITYTPTTGYFGTDILQYNAKNETGTSASSATVTITVNIAKPACTAVTTTVVENSSNNVIDLSKNITNWTNNSSVSLASPPSHGTVSVNAETVVYTPGNNFFGTDSMMFTATNDGGTSSATKISITVTPLVPVCNDTNVTTSENVKATITLKNNITNWTAKSSISVTAQPSHGTTSVSGGVVTYTPTSGYFGTDTFKYSATNETGKSAADATVTITINVIKPTATSYSVQITKNSANIVIGVLDHVTNWTSQSSITITSQPSHGTASVVDVTYGSTTYTNAAINYTPTAGFTGNDSVKFTASNESGASATCTISIKVQ